MSSSQMVEPLNSGSYPVSNDDMLLGQLLGIHGRLLVIELLTQLLDVGSRGIAPMVDYIRPCHRPRPYGFSRNNTSLSLRPRWPPRKSSRHQSNSRSADLTHQVPHADRPSIVLPRLLAQYATYNFPVNHDSSIFFRCSTSLLGPIRISLSNMPTLLLADYHRLLVTWKGVLVSSPYSQTFLTPSPSEIPDVSSHNNQVGLDKQP